jgi:hypothetical protein
MVASGAVGPDGTHRLEVHNPCVDEDLARSGACGLTHLPTGRTCTLRRCHSGPCNLTPRDDAAGVPRAMLDLSVKTRDHRGAVTVVAKGY